MTLNEDVRVNHIRNGCADVEERVDGAWFRVCTGKDGSW